MNKYDQVTLNVAELLEAQAKTYSAWRPEARSADTLTLLRRTEARLARYLTGALYASGLWRRLIYANLKLGWFFEFREYWVKELGLRRLELPDFYFLSGIYRQHFQNLAIANASDGAAFLKTWQNPVALYLLFHYQYKLALHPLAAYTLAKYLPRGSSVCEYGCGLAPVTQCLAAYYPEKNLQLAAADIPSYMLHFVRWKFRATPFVRVLAIDPADARPLDATDATYDAITCLTVLEHLPRPLETVRHLYDQLKPRGLFLFDYIVSEGRGLDTKAALEERREVIRFIREHFTIVRGSIPQDDSSIKAVICRKK